MMFIINDKKSRNVVVSCDHGMFIVNRFDYNSAYGAGQGGWILDHGNVNTVESQIAFNNIINKEDPIIFDVGCNIGTFTSWMCKIFPKAAIYAFEPQRLVYQIACGNMALNNFDNVYLYNMGLGSTNDSIWINEPDYDYNENYGAFSLVNDQFHKSKYKSLIDIMTIDSFVLKYNISWIDFLKVDAEGMDLDVLKGARNTISSCKPSILIEHDNSTPGTTSSMQANIYIDELKKYGYQFEIHGKDLLAKI